MNSKKVVRLAYLVVAFAFFGSFTMLIFSPEVSQLVVGANIWLLIAQAVLAGLFLELKIQGLPFKVVNHGDKGKRRRTGFCSVGYYRPGKNIYRLVQGLLVLPLAYWVMVEVETGGTSYLGRLGQVFLLGGLVFLQSWLSTRETKGFFSSLGLFLGNVVSVGLLMVALVIMRDLNIPFHTWF